MRCTSTAPCFSACWREACAAQTSRSYALPGRCGAIALVLLVGMSVFVLTALMLPFLISLVLRQFLPEPTWVYIQNVMSLVFVGMIVLVFLIAPKVRAGKVHRLHWTAANERTTTRGTAVPE